MIKEVKPKTKKNPELLDLMDNIVETQSKEMLDERGVLNNITLYFTKYLRCIHRK